MQRFRLGDPICSHYRENGFVIIRDLIDPAEIAEIRKDILSIFSWHLHGRGNAVNLANLAEYRTKDPLRWRACARQMQNSLKVLGLLGSSRLQQVLPELGLVVPVVSYAPEVRTDLPFDEVYTQPWHQDWASSRVSLNALTIWMPFDDVRAEHGPLEVIPKSHLLGFCQPRIVGDSVRKFSVDHHVSSETLLPVALSAGEALVFSQFLFHRSGLNRSTQVRLSGQFRFTDLHDSSYAARNIPLPDRDDESFNPTAAQVQPLFAVQP